MVKKSRMAEGTCKQLGYLHVWKELNLVYHGITQPGWKHIHSKTVAKAKLFVGTFWSVLIIIEILVWTQVFYSNRCACLKEIIFWLLKQSDMPQFIGLEACIKKSTLWKTEFGCEVL